MSCLFLCGHVDWSLLFKNVKKFCLGDEKKICLGNEENSWVNSCWVCHITFKDSFDCWKLLPCFQRVHRKLYLQTCNLDYLRTSFICKILLLLCTIFIQSLYHLIIDLEIIKKLSHLPSLAQDSAALTGAGRGGGVRRPESVPVAWWSRGVHWRTCGWPHPVACRGCTLPHQLQAHL